MINALRQLMLHEGFRAHPYKCTAGKWTIGFGRNIDDNPFSDYEMECLNVSQLPPSISWHRDLTLSYAQAYWLLTKDLDKCQDSFKRIFDVEPNLRCPRDAAICNMIYNLGETRFRQFKKTILYYKRFIATRHDNLVVDCFYASEAALEMLDSKWAKQVADRSNQLADQVSTGEWQNMADWPQI